MSHKMQIHPTLFSLFLLCISPEFSHCAAAAGKHDDPQDLVRTSCIHASYPEICIRTLSAYGGPAKTPKDLAQAAVKVSLTKARKVSDDLKSLQVSSPGLTQSSSKRQRAALKDCIEQISDSVDDLSKTLKELKHLRGETFEWQMSNAQTWVSAALTNDDTCTDGFSGVDGQLKSKVKSKITNLAKITSNALYMINRLNDNRGKKPRSKSEP